MTRLFFQILALTFFICFTHDVSSATEDLRDLYLEKKGSYPLRTHHLLSNGDPKYVNELIRQNSPYLLQHAHNPVNWHAWGPRAFDLAKNQNKPILVSVGYSTCHWCHVMERESFENEIVAAFLNDRFISVKVDREEHPDVDEVFLNAVQLLSGKTGWPLNVVISPDGNPFYGATYLSTREFASVLQRIDTLWNTDRDTVLKQAERTGAALAKLGEREPGKFALIGDEVLAQAVSEIGSDFFSSARKEEPAFPREPETLFLLEQLIKTQNTELQAKLQQRLDMIANGGINDHISGGFHRYTLGSDWLVPHFEKMLYNQSQLGEVYSKAFLITGDPLYQQTADSTFDFVLSQMTAPEGGFYSAMDAETSEGEGIYYSWSYEELESLLNAKQLKELQTAFNVSESGNFQNRNVLARSSSRQLSSDKETKLLQPLRRARLSRPAPAIDKKIITSWNASMARSLLVAAKISNNQNYQAAALRALNHSWQTAWDPSKGLARTSTRDQTKLAGTLDDYANYGLAALAAYDVTAQSLWLDRAKLLAERMQAEFQDSVSGAFFLRAKAQSDTSLAPLLTARDDSTTSGNSAAAQFFAKLYHRTGNAQYRSIARSLIATFYQQFKKNPTSMSGMLTALSILKTGEADLLQYAAKGNLRITSKTNGNELSIEIDMQPGWHINANTVLQDYLIPSSLVASEDSCSAIKKTFFPQGQIMQLGFQEEAVNVYENKVTIKAELNSDSDDCHVISTQLSLQACTNEYCAAPEVVRIYTPRDRD